MTMNPRDYDLDELKGIAEEYGEASVAGNGRDDHAGAPIGPEEVLSSNQYRELALLESMSSDGLEKPYLDGVPGTYVAELTVFEWLEFLTTKTGFKRTLETLRYYRSIGWLTEEVEGELAEYLRSFDDPVPGETDGLDRSDHVLSLVYIARLSAMAD